MTRILTPSAFQDTWKLVSRFVSSKQHVPTSNVDRILARDGDQADGQRQRSKVGLAAPLEGAELCAKSAATHGDPLIPNHQLQHLFDSVKCRVSQSHMERIFMKAALLLSLGLSGR